MERQDKLAPLIPTTQRITISKSLSICRFVDRPTQPAGIVQDACKAMKILKSLHENFDAQILLFEPVTNLIINNRNYQLEFIFRALDLIFDSFPRSLFPMFRNVRNLTGETKRNKGSILCNSYRYKSNSLIGDLDAETGWLPAAPSVFHKAVSLAVVGFRARVPDPNAETGVQLYIGIYRRLKLRSRFRC